MITTIKNIIKEEFLFFLVTLLTIIGSIFKAPSVNSIDWKVIACLFNLMLICKALEDQNILDKTALEILKRFNSTKQMAATMILTTAFLAVFITNDVALLTMVPLTIIISKKIALAKNSTFDPFLIIVLETGAANIGSSLTPFGNPQNLFLYSYYNIPILTFLKITIPFTLIGMICLLTINFFTKSEEVQYEIESVHIRSRKKLVTYLILYILVLLSVLRVINYLIVTTIVVIAFLVLDKKLITKIDYFLLGTFIMFFLLIDIISHIGLIQSVAASFLKTPFRVFIGSALASQFISNVPSAVLFSSFTKYFEPLLLGVSVGGLGTLVASLANLISYKLYRKEFRSEKYGSFFHIVNFGMLFIYLCTYFFI